MDNIEFAKAVSRAKIGVLQKRNSTFLTHILYSLPTIADPKIPTANVDGKRVAINPDFYMAQDKDIRMSILVHEAWHVALNHITRGQEFNDQKTYNKAADYVINSYLKKAGFVVPDSWLYDKQYDGMSTSQIYQLLKKNPSPQQPKPQPQQGGGSGTPDLGSDIVPPPVDQPEKATEIQQEVEQKILNAHAAQEMADLQELNQGGKEAGSYTGEIEALIAGYLNPKLPWETILANYMTEYDKSDYSWNRPNRRFMPDLYLPSLYSESMAEIALAFDTSCSVSDQELKQYLTEVQAIIDRLEPLRVSVVAFDTSVKSVDIIEKGEPISKVKLKGRGGTSLFPMMKHYKENPPTVLIVFSDLECTPIPKDEEPDFDVIWICVNNPRGNVNFGKLIHMDI